MVEREHLTSSNSCPQAGFKQASRPVLDGDLLNQEESRLAAESDGCNPPAREIGTKPAKLSERIGGLGRLPCLNGSRRHQTAPRAGEGVP